jgi:hypothetical protein
MRAVTTAVLVLALGPFLQACVVFEGCTREEAPEFSATEEQITRNDVVAALGEPIETIKSEDGHRVDIYEYDQICADVLFVLYIPIPAYVGSPDQMLTVEYGPDGSFLTAQVWRGAEIPEDFGEKLETCNLPFSEATKLDAPTQYDLGTICPSMRSEPRTDPLRWKWMCLAANQHDGEAQHIVSLFYYQGNGPVSQNLVEAYKWSKLALANGSGIRTANYVKTRFVWSCCEYRPTVEQLAEEMTPGQIAEAERQVAEWEPNPAECEVEGEQAEN